MWLKLSPRIKTQLLVLRKNYTVRISANDSMGKETYFELYFLTLHSIDLLSIVFGLLNDIVKNIYFSAVCGFDDEAC